jgi:hypothetical protein
MPAFAGQQSFPMLLSVTQKPFAEFIELLMGTIWDVDELGS